MCVDNSEDLKEAKSLSRELNDDIEYRISQYCVLQRYQNYRTWLMKIVSKLTLLIGKKNRIKIMNED
jgi:hypothetical protein